MAHLGHMFTRLALTLALGASLVRPAAAEEGIGNPVTGEILPGWVQADGSRMAAIRLTLKPGWKTYWRSPGDAGIPPQFDWSGSTNLGGLRIIWPTPQILPQNGMQTIGYTDVLVLPLAIAPRVAGRPVELHAQLDIGVCHDICVPFALSLRGMLGDDAARPTPAIAAALAARPYSAQEAGVTSASCALSPNADGLEITARIDMPAMGRQEVVVIEPGQTGVWTSETDSQRSGGTLTAVGDLVPTASGALAIDRSKITLTVLGGNQAVEINGCTPG